MANRKEGIDLSLKVYTSDIGPHWMACELQTGLMVFSENEQAATNRLSETVDFVLDTIDRREGRASVFEYLKAHGVKHTRLHNYYVGNNGVFNYSKATEEEARELALPNR